MRSEFGIFFLIISGCGGTDSDNLYRNDLFYGPGDITNTGESTKNNSVAKNQDSGLIFKNINPVQNTEITDSGNLSKVDGGIIDSGNLSKVDGGLEKDAKIPSDAGIPQRVDNDSGMHHEKCICSIALTPCYTSDNKCGCVNYWSGICVSNAPISNTTDAALDH